ncbi:hypothetical protein PRIPAC_81247 [Pristionchus pacificus]|uniref:Uncharacterized protein n=1 Tax=Pristionchus pacificus TaxID=54126 RepID=A0A454XM03_PRIPA|nr:hypothetical protein PRIPAC_81247 [Pristionchus pacificus]|eukprot:PDM75409.1 hypothetical protein PRIPAC_42586 [Pristionchus pacificus]
MLLRLSLISLALLITISLTEENIDYDVQLPEKRFRGFSTPDELSVRFFNYPRHTAKVVHEEKNTQEKRQGSFRHNQFLNCMLSLRDTARCNEMF